MSCTSALENKETYLAELKCNTCFAFFFVSVIFKIKMVYDKRFIYKFFFFLKFLLSLLCKVILSGLSGTSNCSCPARHSELCHSRSCYRIHWFCNPLGVNANSQAHLCLWHPLQELGSHPENAFEGPAQTVFCCQKSPTAEQKSSDFNNFVLNCQTPFPLG